MTQVFGIPILRLEKAKLQVNSLSIKLVVITTVFVLINSCAPAQNQKQQSRQEKVTSDTVNNEFKYLKSWIGKQPVREGENFLELPMIKPILHNLISNDIYRRLTNLRQKPYYLIMPIDYINGYFFLHYPPNYHFNQKGDRIMIAFQPSNNEMHVAIITDYGVKWKHSGDTTVPFFMRNQIEKFIP